MFLSAFTVGLFGHHSYHSPAHTSLPHWEYDWYIHMSQTDVATGLICLAVVVWPCITIFAYALVVRHIWLAHWHKYKHNWLTIECLHQHWWRWKLCRKNDGWKLAFEYQFNRLTCCNVCRSNFSIVVHLKRKHDKGQWCFDLFNHHSLGYIHFHNRKVFQ